MIRKAVELGEGELRYESRLPWILYHAKRYRDAIDAYEALFKKFDADNKSDEDRKLLREARLVAVERLRDDGRLRQGRSSRWR